MLSRNVNRVDGYKNISVRRGPYTANVLVEDSSGGVEVIEFTISENRFSFLPSGLFFNTDVSLIGRDINSDDISVVGGLI